MKKKLLFVAPHLSTGGLPQYLYKKLENLINDYEVYLIEYANITGGILVIQRNRILGLIDSKKFYTLGEDKNELLSIIDSINPDYIHMEEMPEYFMDYNIAKQIYKEDRKYKIFETSHDSSFAPESKVFFPDKFLLVSKFQIDMLKSLNIPSTVVEYPIEYKPRPDRDTALKSLGLDPTYKHVVNVGLFTSRKNQGEIFKYAKNLLEYKIKFHFIGNQADNFKDYWEPLLRNKPENCVIWGERNDVDKFYEAADLFLFTSRGFPGDKETSPLVIKEAIGHQTPSLIYNLDVYQNMYDQYPNIKYLVDDGNNETRILDELGLFVNVVEVEKIIDNTKKIVIIDVYATTDDKKDLLRNCIRSVRALGYPIMAVSHCVLPEDIVNSIDYHIFDADNTFNDNNVFGYRNNGEAVLNTHVRKSHEFPIIRSMRLAITAAKNLGYDLFYLTEFDHNYSPHGIEQIRDLENQLFETKNDFTFFYPKEAVFGDIPGKYFDSCFFFGYTNKFLEKFDSYFPKTIEEYNQRFASRFPNCLEHFFWELFKDEKCLIVNTYVKSYFNTSDINISSYRDIDYKIMVKQNSDECYLVINNNNLMLYEYEIYLDGDMISTFSLNANFRIIPLSKDGMLKIRSYKGGLLYESKSLRYNKSNIEEYRLEGWLSFNNEPLKEIKEPIMEFEKIETPNIVDISHEFISSENKLIFTYLSDLKENVSVSVKDIDSKACIFSSNFNPGPAGFIWWVIPLPPSVIVFENNPRFGGFVLEFRNSSEVLLETRELRIKDIPFKKPVMDISDHEPVFMNYEEFFVDRVYDNLDMDNCKTVLDIGANVGLWTKYILSRNAKNVYSFEPNKKAIELLKNTTKNDSNVTIVEKAVYKEKSTLQFYIDDSNSLTSSLLSASGHNPSYNVDAITLEDAINLTGEEKIDLVKIDIEGAEFDIIENLSKDVFDRVDSFLIEFHDFYFTEGMLKVDELEKNLFAAGFTTYRSPIDKVKYVFASKVRKNYYLNHKGIIGINNLYDFSKTFSWDNYNKGIQTAYHQMFNELHFDYNQYTNGCNYERFGCVIESGDTVVDIGANIGMFANIAYHKGAKEILCFEPTDLAFQCLVKNKPVNAQAIKSAVGNYSGITKVFLPSEDDTMGASLYKTAGIPNYSSITTIDLLFESGMVEKIDFLKIDCEGSEKAVIDGISDLNLSKIRKIALEYHSDILTEEDSQKMIDRMTVNGFKTFQLFIGDGNVRIYNFWKE